MSVFQRRKFTDVYFLDTGELAVSASLEDNFHHIQVELVLGPEHEITAATAHFYRIPFDICPEVLGKMAKLCGIKIGPGLTKKVEEAVGGTLGCTHLVDLVMEAARGVMQSNFILMDHDIPFEDRLEEIKQKLRGICHSYSNLDRNPKYQGPRF